MFSLLLIITIIDNIGQTKTTPVMLLANTIIVRNSNHHKYILNLNFISYFVAKNIHNLVTFISQYKCIIQVLYTVCKLSYYFKLLKNR